jgi:hypothetical protein
MNLAINADEPIAKRREQGSQCAASFEVRNA